MSKKTVLEMFKDIKELETADGPKITVEDLLPFFCENIDKALQRLEAIDNANPSEALKRLEEWYGFLIADNDTTYSNGNENEIEYNRRKETIYKQYYTIKQALLKAQEQEKVLEIIKEKRVNLYYFDIASDVEIYNNWIVILYGYPKEFLLTQEEFELLKRYFNE